MVTQSPAFKTAVEDSRKLTSKPTNDELLELYGLFKTGTGENFDEAAAPSLWDLKGKAKHGAWKKVKDTPVDEAQKQYVELVEKLKTTRGYDPNKVPE